MDVSCDGVNFYVIDTKAGTAEKEIDLDSIDDYRANDYRHTD